MQEIVIKVKKEEKKLVFECHRIFDWMPQICYLLHVTKKKYSKSDK